MLVQIDLCSEEALRAVCHQAYEEDNEQMMSEPEDFIERSTNHQNRRTGDDQQTHAQNHPGPTRRRAQHRSNAQRTHVHVLERIHGYVRESAESMISNQSFVVMNVAADVQQRPEADGIANATMKCYVLVEQPIERSMQPSSTETTRQKATNEREKISTHRQENQRAVEIETCSRRSRNTQSIRYERPQVEERRRSVVVGEFSDEQRQIGR